MRKFEKKKTNTKLQKLCREKKNTQIRVKNHLTLPNKIYDKKKKMAKILAKKAPNTTLEKLCQEKKVQIRP